MKSHLIVGLLSCAVSLIVFSAELPTKTPPLLPTQLNNKAKIDLNVAQPPDLLHVIKGIGLKRAAAIVAYREQHHGFKSLEELEKVPGIGKRFVSAHLQELQAAFKIS